MRPTLRRKASFLSSSKAALPGGLRLSGEAAGQLGLRFDQGWDLGGRTVASDLAREGARLEM